MLNTAVLRSSMMLITARESLVGPHVQQDLNFRERLGLALLLSSAQLLPAHLPAGWLKSKTRQDRLHTGCSAG